MGEAVWREIEETIRHLAERWKDAGVLLPGFPLLAQGRPVPLTDLVEASGVPQVVLEAAIESGRCERDSKGRLVDLYGMSLNPTLHRIEVRKKIVYSCCALWAHVIPKLLNQDVQVESVDPIRREIVRLKITPAGVDSIEPDGAVATMAVPSRSEIHRDVSAAFCCQVNHFMSRQSAEQFLSERPRARVIEIGMLQEAGRRLYDTIWSVIRE